jgi:hypothetical protein
MAAAAANNLPPTSAAFNTGTKIGQPYLLSLPGW